MERQLITFNLMEEEYGIDILQVEGINRLKEISITRVPRAEQFIEGVINLRGNVIPIIDLRKRFDLGSTPKDRDARIIVVQIEEKLIGLLVDRVNEVVSVNTNNIGPPPEEVTQIDTQFLDGIARLKERLILVLNVHEMLSSKEQEELVNMTEMK